MRSDLTYCKGIGPKRSNTKSNNAAAIMIATTIAPLFINGPQSIGMHEHTLTARVAHSCGESVTSPGRGWLGLGEATPPVRCPRMKNIERACHNQSVKH